MNDKVLNLSKCTYYINVPTLYVQVYVLKVLIEKPYSFHYVFQDIEIQSRQRLS